MPFPREAVYRWWTDFREGDHLTPGSPRKAIRQVRRRERNQIWLRDRAVCLPFSIEARVTLRPPEGYDVDAQYPGADVRYGYRFEPAGRGTRIAFRADIRPRRLGRIVVPLAAPWIRQYARRDLDFHLREMAKNLTVTVRTNPSA